jgi:hypothetical protein
MTSPDKLVDWDQLLELLGDTEDLAQRPLLAGMWRDMVGDLARDMAALSDLKTDAEAKSTLHRLRGLVAMWGLCGLAARMKVIEDGAAPLAVLLQHQGELADIATLSRSEVAQKHTWLETDSAD